MFLKIVFPRFHWEGGEVTQAETAQVTFEVSSESKPEVVSILHLNCGFCTAGGDRSESDHKLAGKWQISGTQCLLKANLLAHSPCFTIDALSLLPQDHHL